MLISSHTTPAESTSFQGTAKQLWSVKSRQLLNANFQFKSQIKRTIKELTLSKQGKLKTRFV